MNDLPIHGLVDSALGNAAGAAGATSAATGVYRDAPRVLVIGGFDPNGGAGVVRDFLTARTLGAVVRLIPTAWTEQSRRGVSSVEPRDPEPVARAVRSSLACGWTTPGQSGGRVADDGDQGFRPASVKIGMLPNGGVADAVAGALDGFAGPVVLDPVLSASSGGLLFEGDPAALVSLAAHVTLMTPNTVEAAALTGVPIRTPADAANAGRALCARGVRAVLVKGGHMMTEGDSAIDVLVTGTGEQRFSAARISGSPVRGTGCALATAIAVELGRGLGLADAIAEAKRWLTGALARAIDVEGERHLP